MPLGYSDRLLAGRTAIVIAHRLSTIRSADVICVMHAGRIVMRGRHEDLLAQGGIYRDLYEGQFVANAASGRADGREGRAGLA